MTEPDALADGELVVLGRFRDASNVTLLAEARVGDVSVRCVYKPVAGERPLWDFPSGTLAGREVSAYLLSESLGWGLVPRTLLREGPHGPGMVQEWVEETTPEPVQLVAAGEEPDGYLAVLSGEDAEGHEVTVVHEDSARLVRLAVFDVVINNADRKGSHVLSAAEGRVLGVDHGVSFHSAPKLRTVLWGFAGRAVPDDVLSDLDEWVGRSTSLVELSRHLDDDETRALVARTRQLLETGTMPLPRAGAPTIPWPPL